MSPELLSPVRRQILAGSIAALCLTSVASAADQTWKTTGFTNGNWTTTTNWVGGAVPGGASGVASGDTATFNGGFNLTVTPDAARNIKNITFDTASAGAFTIAGGGLVLTNAGAITINSNVVNTQTINTNLLLSTTASSTYSFINNSTTSGAKLNIGGNVTGQATATNEVLTLGGTNGGTVSGIIGNGSGGGTVGVTKTGTGTWTLTGANTFTGGLNVSAGTLVLDFANLVTPTNLVASTNALTLGSGTSLSIKAKTGGGVATSQTLGNVAATAGGASILIDPNNSASATLALGTLTATATGSSLLLGTALSAGTGTVTITTTTNKNAQNIYGGRIVFADGTADTGYDWATTASGGSPYTLEAYAGYTTMVAGATSDTLNQRVTGGLTLSGAHTHNSLKIEDPAASQILDLGANLLTLNSGGLLVTGTNEFTISGTGAGTRLTAGNGSGSYDLIVHQYNSGGLAISAVIGNNGGNATALTKTGSGSMTLSGANTYTGATTISGGTVTAGVASVANTSGALGNNSAITFTNTAGTALDITGFNTQVGSLNGGGTVGGNITLGSATLTTGGGNGAGSYAGVISGNGNLIKIGSGNQTLTGANDYSGTTTISAGTLQIGNGGGTGSLGSGDVTNNATLFFNRTGSYTVANNISGTGVINVSGGASDTLTLSGALNVTTLNMAATTNVILSGSASNTMALNFNNYTNAKVTLAKTGGAIAVSGNITMATGWGEAYGTLALGGNEQIADTATVTLGSAGYSGNTKFQLLNFSETIAGLNSSGVGFVGGSTGNVAVENGSASAGTSTLTVSGSGTYNYGPVTQSNVRLRNGSTGVLAFTKNGTGTQIFSSVGDLSYTGATTVNNGILSIRSSNLSGSAVTLAGGTLDLQTATINTAISGTTGQVTVSAGTTTNFGGGNKTYSGNTVISGGTTILLQTAANSLSANSIHSIGTGAILRTGNLAGSVKALTGAGSVDLNGASAHLTITDGSNQIFSGAIGGLGRITKTGPGTQLLIGANSYTGGTTVTGGTLIVSSLGTGNLTLNGGNFAYQPAAEGALNVGTGVLNFANGSRIGTAVGGDTLGESAITSSVAAVTTGAITIDVFGIPGVAPTDGTNNLITAASGLDGATYTLGNVYNATNFTIVPASFAASGTAITVGIASQTAASDLYWKGGYSGGATQWAISDGISAGNWTTDAAGTIATSLVPGTTGTVHFSATGATGQATMTLGANMSVGGIVVDDSSGITLNADLSTLTTGSAGITVNSGAGAVNLAAPIVLGSAQTWANDSSNLLTVSGNIANGGFLLTSGGTGNTTLSGILSGTGGLTKANAGTLVLSGVNTYTGATIVSGGELQIGGAGQLNSGAYAGTISLASGTTLNVNSTASQTLSGAISGAGALVKNNSGTLTLSVKSTFTGGTTVNNGVLTLNGGGDVSTATIVGSLTINPGATVNARTSNWDFGYSGVATSGTTQITIDSGTLNFTGTAGTGGMNANLTMTNGLISGSQFDVYSLAGGHTLTVNAGTSTISSGIRLRNPTGFVIDTASGGALTISGVLISDSAANGNLTKNGLGSLTLSVANTYNGITKLNAGTTYLTHSSALAGTTLDWNNNGGALDLGSLTTVSIGALQGAQNFSMLNASATPLALSLGGGNQTATYTGALLGGTTLTKTGTGTQTLGGATSNTYTGTTTVFQGALSLGKTGGATALGNELIFDNNLSPDVYTTVNNQFAPGTIVSFVTDSGDHGRLELMGTTQTVAGIRTVGYTGQRGVIQNREMGPANTGNSTLVLDGAGDYTFTGFLRNSSGTIAVSKTGAGTQTLVGPQITYTGATTVSNGILALEDTTAFNSAITVSGSGVLNSVRTTTGFASRDNILGDNIAGNGVLNINNTGSGIAGGWTIVGVANGLTMAGTININSGTLSRDNGTLNNINTTATVNVAAGAAFGAGRGGNSTIGALNGAGDVGTFWVTTSAGSITLGNGNASGSFSGILHGSGVGVDGTIEGGVLSLIKIGTGTQTLSGTSTYTGSTTVRAGTLLLDFAVGGTSNILSSSSALVLGSGTLEIKGGSGETNTQTVNGISGVGTVLLTQNSATSVSLTLGTIAAGSAINFTGSDATVGALGATNYLTTTTTTNNNGTTRLGAALWNGTNWASTSNTGGNHVVAWTGTFSDLTTDGNSLANPTGDLRITGGTAAGTAATYSANTTINSLLMIDASNSTTVALGGGTLTVATGAAATGVIAIGTTGKSLTIGSTAGDGVVTSGSSGASTIILNNASTAGATLTVNSAITNGASTSVALVTTGAVTLAGASTYTGGTTISTGTLQIGGAGTLGAAGTYAGAISNAGVLQHSSSANQTFSGAVTGVGSLIKDGAGTLTLTNTGSTYTGATTVSNGTLEIKTSANTTLGTAITVNNGGTFAVTNTATQSMNAAITLNNGATMTHNGQNAASQFWTNSQAVTVAAGASVTFNETSLANTTGINKGTFLDAGLRGGGANTVVTINATNAGNGFTVRNGASNYVGKIIVNGIANGTSNLGSGFAVTNETTGLQNADIEVNGTLELGANGLGWAGTNTGTTFTMGTLTGTGVVTNNNTSTARALTVGNTNQSGTYSGILQNGTAVLALTKTGTGTQTLSGINNTYTGNTTVTDGTLLVSGSISGSLVAVNGGTFGGTGSVTTNNKSFTLASGAKLDPGTNGSTGLSVNTGSSTLDISAGVGGANTGALLFHLNGTTTSDKITLSLGTLAIGSAQLNFADFAFTTGGSFGEGSYTLFDTNAGISGTLAGSGLSGTVGGFDATLAISGNDVVLLVVPEPGSAVSLMGGLGMLLGLQRFRRRRA